MSSTINTESNDKFDFFRRIGSPKRIVAPMVDQCDLAFRMLTRKYKADLVYTQMFSSNNVASSESYRDDHFQTCEGDRPLIGQIAGHDPKTMFKAAKYLEHMCDAIDVNLGCPQGIAKRGRYGAFLMEELELLHNIVSTLVQGLSIPVTCKTRIYKDYDRSIRLCETLVNAGASMLVIHGRTREEKGQAVGEVDWDMIRRIKLHFGSRVPIVANGGISHDDDIDRCLAITGADGVMTSEAILENPTLFTSYICPITHKKLTQIDIAEEYLELCKLYPPRHIKTIRSHMMKFLYRYYMQHDELRDKIATAGSLDDFIDTCILCRELIGEEEEKYDTPWYTRHRSIIGQDEDGHDMSSSRVDQIAYKRPVNSLFVSNNDWECNHTADNDHVDACDVEGEVGLGIFDGLGMFQ